MRKVSASESIRYGGCMFSALKSRCITSINASGQSLGTGKVECDKRVPRTRASLPKRGAPRVLSLLLSGILASQALLSLEKFMPTLATMASIKLLTTHPLKANKPAGFPIPCNLMKVSDSLPLIRACIVQMQRV